MFTLILILFFFWRKKSKDIGPGACDMTREGCLDWLWGDTLIPQMTKKRLASCILIFNLCFLEFSFSHNFFWWRTKSEQNPNQTSAWWFSRLQNTNIGVFRLIRVKDKSFIVLKLKCHMKLKNSFTKLLLNPCWWLDCVLCYLWSVLFTICPTSDMKSRVHEIRYSL